MQEDKNDELNPLEQLKRKKEKKWYFFVLEYIKDFNATRAASIVGYKGANIKRRACELLKKPEILAAIAWAIKERSERTKVDSDYVLKRLVEIDQMDVLDIMTDTMELKPVSEWPKIWRQFISGFDVAEISGVVGGNREAIGLLKKIKWPDKVKNLELLGKHVDVQAFSERKELTGADGEPLMPGVIKVVHE